MDVITNRDLRLWNASVEKCLAMFRGRAVGDENRRIGAGEIDLNARRIDDEVLIHFFYNFSPALFDVD